VLLADVRQDLFAERGPHLRSFADRSQLVEHFLQALTNECRIGSHSARDGASRLGRH
jgi:hypothetical protein